MRPGTLIVAAAAAAARRALLHYLRVPVTGPATAAGIGRVARRLSSSSTEEAAKGLPPSLGEDEVAVGDPKKVDPAGESRPYVVYVEILNPKHATRDVTPWHITMLANVLGSEEEAREKKMILSGSYNSEFSGFAARLTESQAKKIAGWSYYPVKPSTDENVMNDWELGWGYAEEERFLRNKTAKNTQEGFTHQVQGNL